MQGIKDKEAQSNENGKKKVASVPGFIEKKFVIIEDLLSQRFTGIIIVMMIIGTCIDVFSRYVLNTSMLGLAEASELLVLVITFSSLSIVEKTDAHIKVDLLERLLMKRRVGIFVKFFINIPIGEVDLRYLLIKEK